MGLEEERCTSARTSECIQEHSPCNVVMNSSCIAAQHYHEICPDEQSTCLQQHWTATQRYLIDSSDVESSVQSLPEDTMKSSAVGVRSVTPAFLDVQSSPKTCHQQNRKSK